MTLRQVTARPVDTYVRPDSSRVQQQKQRKQQVASAFQKLGVTLQKKEVEEDARTKKRLDLEWKQKQASLEAVNEPLFEQDMQRPEMYKLSPEEFAKSETYKRGYDAISNSGFSQDRVDEALVNYHGRAMQRYSEGRVKQEYIDKEHTSSLAIQRGAEVGGVAGLMEAFSDAKASGIKDEDAFTSVLASAKLKGANFLKQVQGASNWTPKQDEAFQRNIKSLTAKTSSFNMALEAGKVLANNQRFYNDKLAAKTALFEQHKGSMTIKQQQKFAVELLETQVQARTEELAAGLLGHYTVKQLSQGIGLPSDAAPLSVSHLRMLQASEVNAAYDSKDYRKLLQLSANPTDIPPALTSRLSGVFQALESAKPDDPNSMDIVEEAFTALNTMNDQLGSETLKESLKSERYADYTALRQAASVQGLSTAISNYQASKALDASGINSSSHKKILKEVADSVNEELQGGAVFSYFKSEKQSDAVLAQLLEHQVRAGHKMGLTKEAIETNALEYVEKSQWDGYLNGAVVGRLLHRGMTSDTGSRYGDRGASELMKTALESYGKEQGFEEVRPVFTVSGKVLLTDTDGRFLPSSFNKQQDFVNWVLDANKTTKEEIKEDAARRKQERDNVETYNANSAKNPYVRPKDR